MRVYQAPQPTGITSRVLTLAGLKDLRDRLKTEDVEKVRAEFEGVYFRDGHGTLHRVFPKKGKR